MADLSKIKHMQLRIGLRRHAIDELYKTASDLIDLSTIVGSTENVDNFRFVYDDCMDKLKEIRDVYEEYVIMMNSKKEKE